jgi:hypothetical protein
MARRELAQNMSIGAGGGFAAGTPTSSPMTPQPRRPPSADPGSSPSSADPGHGMRSPLLEDFRNNKNRKFELRVRLNQRWASHVYLC